MLIESDDALLAGGRGRPSAPGLKARGGHTANGRPAPAGGRARSAPDVETTSESSAARRANHPPTNGERGSVLFVFGTHRSAVQRLRLHSDRDLGAGNFFWRAWRVAQDRDRPLLFHPDVQDPHWAKSELRGLSLDDIRVKVIRYAARYRDNGVGPSSHVGIYTRDGLEGLLHHIAITSLGAAAVHCNPRMEPATAADYFQRTRTSVLVGDKDLLDGCTEARPQQDGEATAIRLAQDIATFDATAPLPPARLPGFPYRHRPDDLVMISHSSGTTGRPKAPVFTHQGFFIGKRERLWTFPSLRADRMLTALPHSHSAGISYLSMALLLGIPTLLLDDANGSSVTQAINLFHPTFVLGFPLTLAEIDVEDVHPRAARNIHSWNGMGDASHERHIKPLLGVGSRPGRPGSRYNDGLGSSEMGMVLFRQTYTPESTEYARLIGHPAGVVRQAAVLDETGAELPNGQAGMLGVRTPSVTPGYWDDPELNQQSLLSGYFLTGDIVRRDEEGRFYHLDRIPDVIHSATGPVYSLPLEEVVLLTTQALDTAVVAVDDPDAPDASVPLAVVLFRDGAVRTTDDLLATVNAELSRQGLPLLRALIVAADRSDLPVGVTGKVLKRQLRERHRTLLQDPVTRRKG
ncbi:class I adenylate-forming enzyme family protein [Streptomyces sp. NPDC046985]|uniref:class I adenylate-forming enzyme family protein n=1 Tax=Streptomyces sp. NPDC046985 TaxID=3155377 RepID=UPI0033EE390C